VTVPHVADVVGDVMWTMAEAPGAIVVEGHVRIPAAIEQKGVCQPDWLSIDQLSPGLVGSVSLSVTPVAFPAPVFETVIVYPIVVPGITLAESAVLVIDRFGQFTVIGTMLDDPEPALELE
jgi:hypothetical protein